MELSTTNILIAINVIASIYAWNNQDVYYKWMMNPYQTYHRKQYYRFLTSGFIHVDTMHILFNMLTLYFFGDAVEYIIAKNYNSREMGRLVYVGFYLVAIVVSEIPTFLKHINNPSYNSLGASGAVSAVIFIFILYYPLNTLLIFGIIPIPAFLLGIFYIWYSIQMGRRRVGNINHDAHLYGALFGVLFSVVSNPRVLIEFVMQLREFTLF